MTMAGTSISPLQMIAGEDLEAHRLVRFSGSTENTVVYADSGERAIGVTLARADSGNSVAVELLTAGGTLKVIAAGTITVNSVVYTANDGKVSDSVAGEPIGRLRKAGSAGVATELLPYGMAGGDTDKDLVELIDDFFYYTDGDMWLLDANGGGGATEQDAQGGTVALDCSDTTAADNDETYLLSFKEIYKPAIGAVNGEVLAIFKARVKFTEANTDDAAVFVGLLGGDSTDVADTIADGGAAPTDANQYIGFFKADGGAVWQGVVRDTAQDSDSNVGARTSGSFAELKMVIYDADITDGELEVEFFVDGVSGGTLTYAVSGATEMRILFGIKNGGANEEVLHIDKVYFAFKR